jgi:hypothetical protein
MNENLNKMKASRLKNKGFCLLVAIMTLLIVPAGCSDEEETPTLALSENIISIATSGATAVIAVTASEPWGAVPDDDEPWCSLELSDTRLTVICTANKTGSSRSARIWVSTAHKSARLEVCQSGS